MLCTRCNKNVAVIFVTRMEGGKTVNEGLCMPCARELGINTMQQMAGGLDMGDMENLEAQMMDMFENADGSPDGGENPFSSFLSHMFGGFPPASPENGIDGSEKSEKKGTGKDPAYWFFLS